MLRFKNFITEEVLPTGQVSDGSIDIEKTAVRGQINATLASVTAQPAVTPYIVLNRIQKTLAYFHIILPKRAYLEGDRGVEVIEVRQFGHRMGMTNAGEFVKDVPARYFLFVSYRLASSIGADYASVGGVFSSVGGMFKVTAKLVDEIELQRLMSAAEMELAEGCDAEAMQKMAKAIAPKEEPHTVLGDCDCGPGNSPSTQSAIKVMMKKQIDEVSLDKLVRYKNKAGEGREKGVALADKKMKGKAKVNASMPKNAYMEEETLDELKHSTLKAYKSAAKADRDVSKEVVKKGLDTEGKFKHAIKKRKKGLERVSDRLEEKAPPGAKFERMVKHIKKGYSKDGLTKKEKGIAYATAWKAKNRETSE